MNKNIIAPSALAEALAAHFRNPPTHAKLLTDIGGGCVLVSRTQDFWGVLVGIVKTEDGNRIPLIEQRIEYLKGKELIQVQTKEQACMALAESALEMAKRYASGELVEIIRALGCRRRYAASPNTSI